jgi:hypothetical protein
MTDTRSFKTTAVKRTTGEWKVFYGFLASTHHDAAIEWLSQSQEQTTKKGLHLKAF